MRDTATTVSRIAILAMRVIVTTLLCLFTYLCLGANPDYRAFRGTGGVAITTNPPTGLIIIDGSGIFTSSGTNATIAVSTNGVLVAVASTNINFVTGSNVFLAATNIGSRTHIGINAFTPVPFIEGAVTNLLLTWILPILTVDSLTVSNLLAAPPLSSVQYNSNGITRGSAGLIYTNGQLQVADVVIAGQGVEVTTGSFVLNGGTTALVAWNGLGRIRWDSDGVMRLENDAALGLNRINLGGTTAAFPAIGRTNGDVIILGANGNFKLGGSTNRLIAPAVHIANDGGVGTPLLSLDNPLSGIRWDLAIDSNPQTYFLGLVRVGDTTPTMVWEIGGNVGIGTTNPATTLDVNGRTFLRSNVWMSAIPSNATPVAFLATDSGGEVYETAIPTVAASAETNAVLTNLIGTVARNVTNVVSLSTTNATSNPLTNAFANGVLTLFGIEAGANVTVTPNGSNLVIAATAGSSVASPISSVQFNSNGVQQGSEFFVFTNRFVGVGTNAPVSPLHIRPILSGQRYLRIDDTNGTPRMQVGTYPGGGGFGGVWLGDVTPTTVNANLFSDGSSTYFNGSASLEFASAGAVKWSIGSAGHLLTSADDTYDIGASAGTRPRSVFVARRIVPNNVTASRMAAFHTDKTLTNAVTTTALFDNFFAMGISNITNFGSGIAIGTNGGTLTISNTQSGAITVSGHSNAIPFINGAGNAFTYMDSGGGFGSLTNPGFGFNPIVSGGPQAGYGGLMVFANQSMGLLTVGHPNAGSDFATFTTALCISNRYNSAADFKNDMVKFDAVMVGTGLRSDSTLSRWRVWQGTSSSNDVAEINLNGQIKLYGGTLYRSNTVALPTAAELGAGGYWVGVSNNATANTLVAIYSVDGASTAMKHLAP